MFWVSEYLGNLRYILQRINARNMLFGFLEALQKNSFKVSSEKGSGMT